MANSIPSSLIILQDGATTPPKRKHKAPTLRDSDWEPHKSRILELHIAMNMPLPRVRTTMINEARFTAEVRQYRSQISKWNMDKNIKPAEMRAIVRIRQKRKLIDAHSPQLKFVVRGLEVDTAKIERWMRRHGISESLLFDPTETSIPETVTYHEDLAPTDINRSEGVAIMSDLLPASGSPSRRLDWKNISPLSGLVALSLLTSCYCFNGNSDSAIARQKSRDLFETLQACPRYCPFTLFGIFGDRYEWDLPISESPGTINVQSVGGDSFDIHSDIAYSLFWQSYKLPARKPIHFFLPGSPFGHHRDNNVEQSQTIGGQRRLLNMIRADDGSSGLLDYFGMYLQQGGDLDQIFSYAAWYRSEALMEFFSTVFPGVYQEHKHRSFLSSLWYGFTVRKFHDTSDSADEHDLQACMRLTDLYRYKCWPNLEAHELSIANQDLLLIPTQYSCPRLNQDLEQLLHYWLRIGCDIEFRDSVGRTPLLAAAASSSIHASHYLQLLVGRGANIHARDTAGEGALYLATETMVRLCAATASITRLRVLEGQRNILITLLKAGCDPKAMCRQGITPGSLLCPNTDAMRVWEDALSHVGYLNMR